MKVKALVPIFGSNRMLAEHVGKALKGCEWVGVPFAGGCCEVPHIKARTIVVNDVHRHLMNLCRVVGNPIGRDSLVDLLNRVPFHPSTLEEAQRGVVNFVYEPPYPDETIGCHIHHIHAARHYFICCWMTRSGSAGTPAEFTGKLALRWEAGGGDSNIRFRSAIDSLDEWYRIFVDRCTFSTIDAFEFLDKCKDQAGHGVYADPPFYIAGRKYTHNAGKGDAEVRWHEKLAERLTAFKAARVVLRCYDVPLIRVLYSEQQGWTYHYLDGRKQTNDPSLELLIVRNA